MTPTRATRVATLVSLAVPLLAAVRVWTPLLGNFFFADDFLHLFDIVTRDAGAFLTQLWGGHLYVVRNAVFLATFALFGPEPRAFFWSVLVTHLASVVLLHRTLRRLTDDRLLAGAGAVLWATCPALEGALGWYSVYGQVLLTTITLVVLGDLARLLGSHGTLSAPRALAWGVLLVLGGACFGTGIGLAVAFPLAVVVALPSARRAPYAVAVLVGAAAVLVAVYVALAAQAPERQPRLAPGGVLADVPVIAGFAGHLLAIGSASLLGGALDLAAGHPNVVAVETAAIAAAVVVAGWLVADGARRRQIAAAALLLGAAYGTVAAGRGAVLDAVHLSLAESAAWPRYHYLPLALLTLVLATAAAALHDVAGRVAVVAVAAWTAVPLALVVSRPPAIDHHDADRRETESVVRAVRAAVAAAPPGATVTIDNRPFRAAALPSLFPGWAGVFAIWFPGDSLDGRPVRFLSSQSQWRIAQERGGRIAALVLRRPAAAATGPP